MAVNKAPVKKQSSGRIRPNKSKVTKSVLPLAGIFDRSRLKISYDTINILANLGVKQNLINPYNVNGNYKNQKLNDPMVRAIFSYEIIDGVQIDFRYRAPYGIPSENITPIRDLLVLHVARGELEINELSLYFDIEGGRVLDTTKNTVEEMKKTAQEMRKRGFNPYQVFVAIMDTFVHTKESMYYLYELTEEAVQIDNELNKYREKKKKRHDMFGSAVSDFCFLHNSINKEYALKKRDTNFPFFTKELVESGSDFMLDYYEFFQYIKPENADFIRAQKPKVRKTLIKSLEFSSGYLNAFKIRFGRLVEEANKYPKLYSNDRIIDILLDLKELKPKFFREAFYILEDLKNEELKKKIYIRIFNKLQNKSSMKAFLKECKTYMVGVKSEPARKDALQKGLTLAAEYDPEWEEKIFEFKLSGEL